jgi:putative ABC transport system ATP-binding protein
LANEPKILLADEPTGNLDPASVDVVLGVFDEARRERGTTVVMVTHDPLVAARADRVIQLRAGHVLAPPASAAAGNDPEPR